MALQAQSIPDDVVELCAPQAPVMNCMVQEIAHFVLPGLGEVQRISATMFCLVVAASFMDARSSHDVADTVSWQAWCGIIDELTDRGIVPDFAAEACREYGMKAIAREKALGRALTAEEFAEVLAITADQYHALQREVNALLMFGHDGGAAPGDETLGGIAAMVGDVPDASPGRMVDALARTIDGLPEMEMIVVNLFYIEELTLAEIGELLQLDERQVTRLHRQAIVRLRSQLHCC